ncbi:trypsin-like peptidase domain-containing protein [Candidatus Woesearchaeota archaeon]|nr:trypsin-like peptidase domain-containing protein [Candidatus Woesearchaeota archaeon]
MDPELFEKALEETERELAEELEEEKQWGFLEKLAFGIKSAVVGAAGMAGIFFYMSANDYFGTHERIEEAKEEAVRTIEIREEYVLESQRDILDEQERILENQEELKNKQREVQDQEWQLKEREIFINGEKRKVERGKISLESEQSRLERERLYIEFERDSLESRRRILDSEKSLLETREEFLDKKEEVLSELDKKVAQKVLESADHCLAFTLFFDHNRNYVIDDLDSKISERFLGGISVLSDRYLSSVRYVHNPTVLKKLEQYGVTGPVLSINDETVLIYDKEEIKKVITNVPEESLYDFEFSPQGKEGIEEILSNRKSREVSPVSMFDEEKLGGSGFVLGNNYIATAYHVVDGMQDEFTITFEDGKKIKTSKKSMIAYSEEFDIAVLRVEFGGYDPVVLREDIGVGHLTTLKRAPTNINYKKGETARGHIYCNESVTFSSLLNSENINDLPVVRGADSYITTIEAFPGDSGSPIVDFGGDVVGVTSGVYNNKKGSTAIIKTKYLRRLLEQYEKKCE